MRLEGDDRGARSQAAGEQERSAVGDDQHPPLPARDDPDDSQKGAGGDRSGRQHRDEADRGGQVEPGGGDRGSGRDGQDHRRAQERPHEHDAMLAAHEMDVLVGREQSVDLGHAPGAFAVRRPVSFAPPKGV